MCVYVHTHAYINAYTAVSTQLRPFFGRGGRAFLYDFCYMTFVLYVFVYVLFICFVYILFCVFVLYFVLAFYMHVYMHFVICIVFCRFLFFCFCYVILCVLYLILFHDFWWSLMLFGWQKQLFDDVWIKHIFFSDFCREAGWSSAVCV